MRTPLERPTRRTVVADPKPVPVLRSSSVTPTVSIIMSDQKDTQRKNVLDARLSRGFMTNGPGATICDFVATEIFLGLAGCVQAS